ncbi:MAG: hypothetical protein IKP32_07565 [Clostridia bacterium]|nr:hypothetical protein [Clostridia bacterium]
MGRKVRLLYVLTAAFVIAAISLMILNRLDGEIAVKQAEQIEVRQAASAVNAKTSDLTQELNFLGTDAGIRKEAMAQGYLMPGQIRFKVRNPEVLYDEPAAEDAE